jgi:DNA-binding transcriptional LysR family regulator
VDLKIDDLKAFLEVYQAGTFSGATSVLGISQSALSQKIARIENVLQSTVFVRHPRSLSLTTTGDKLFIYAKEVLEKQSDFLNKFDQYSSEVSGVIRIAGFSSIMRSIIIPKLAPLMSKYPGIKIEFSTYEMFELEKVLTTNKVDFIVTDYYPEMKSFKENKIMEEEYVIIESKKHKSIPNIFIDHGAFDNATESYFSYLKETPDYERVFMGEVYSIVDGVALGLGRAVMSKHIIKDDKRFNIIKKRKKYIRPVVLSSLGQSYYSPIHNIITETLA